MNHKELQLIVTPSELIECIKNNDTQQDLIAENHAYFRNTKVFSLEWKKFNWYIINFKPNPKNDAIQITMSNEKATGRRKKYDLIVSFFGYHNLLPRNFPKEIHLKFPKGKQSLILYIFINEDELLCFGSNKESLHTVELNEGYYIDHVFNDLDYLTIKEYIRSPEEMRLFYLETLGTLLDAINKLPLPYIKQLYQEFMQIIKDRANIQLDDDAEFKKLFF
jgi:hypothetical protein